MRAPLTAAARRRRRRCLTFQAALPHHLQMSHSMQAAAAARVHMLGRLFRLTATYPAAAALPAYQRAPLRCWAAASSAADLGSSRHAANAAAAASGAVPADADTAADMAAQLTDTEELELSEGEAQPGLPRKLGSEAVEAGGTGAFQRLPMVAPSKELLDSAVRRAARVPYNKKLKNEAQKAKNRRERGGGGVPAH